MDANSFAFRLKELLEHKKLTLQAVANQLGISRTAVHKWTRGGEIDDDNLRRLAAFLQVNWIWLRYGEQAQQDAQNAEAVVLPMTDVRRKYTAEIMESEARMKLAQENARIVTWEWNLITDEVTYSSNVEQVYGWHVSRNDEFWPHVIAEDAANLRAVSERSIATGTPYETDFRIVTPSGEIRWIASRATPLQDSAGRTVKMIGISMDNSARKSAEERLRASEERFRAIFEQACGAMAYVSLDGRWLKINQSLCQLLGYSADELGGLSIQALTHPDDLDGNLELLERLKAGEIAMYALDKRLRHRDGHYLWVRVKTSLQRSAQDGSPEQLIALIEDIGAERAERQGLQARARLLERLCRSEDSGEWRFERDSGRLHCDATCARLLGRRSAARLDNLAALLLQLQEQDAAQLEALVRDAGKGFALACHLEDGAGRVEFLAEPQDDGRQLVGLLRPLRD
ncbi:PAS domain S-box protein [Pseudomonas oryzae]|uniref:histidine kinase n=1 Tax=Pseudomonas oryzae TaxID=1392877 RepID=A0A1H1URN6_9PSED|nr:PAS domain S-box-containing protein [Pseudomonas oryzae]